MFPNKLLTMRSRPNRLSAQYLLFDEFLTQPGTLNGRPVESGKATPVSWVVDSGIWVIANGTVSVTSATANTTTTAESGQADVTVELTHDATALTKYIAGIVFRYQDVNNNWIALIESDASNPYFNVMKKTGGGAYASQGTNFNTTIGRHDMKVVLSGSSILAYLDGVQRFSFTDSAFATATKHGMYGYTATAYVTSSLSNFKVSPP